MGSNPIEIHDYVMHNLGAQPWTQAVTITPYVIDAFEKRVGYQLPAGYAAFLKRYGFYTLTGDYVVCDAPNDTLDVKSFYGLGSNTGHDLERHFPLDWEGVPDTMLAVASSDCGKVALSLAGADAGHVYLCASPHLEMDGPIYLADSFEAFLLLLRIDDESAD